MKITFEDIQLDLNFLSFLNVKIDFWPKNNDFVLPQIFLNIVMDTNTDDSYYTYHIHVLHILHISLSLITYSFLKTLD